MSYMHVFELLVDHGTPLGAVHTLVCIHAKSLQALVGLGPCVTAGHELSCQLFVPYC